MKKQGFKLFLVLTFAGAVCVGRAMGPREAKAALNLGSGLTGGGITLYDHCPDGRRPRCVTCVSQECVAACVGTTTCQESKYGSCTRGPYACSYAGGLFGGLFGWF